jgi:hypothetical protein
MWLLYSTPDNSVEFRQTVKKMEKCLYYEMTGFWPEQVAEISRELIFLPPVIRCRYTGCVVYKDLLLQELGRS